MPSSPADPEAITETSVVRRRGGVGTVLCDGDAVVVDQAGGRAHALNATGALVWQCLDGDDALAGLIDDLAGGFGADRPTVAAQVLGLAGELARLGLLDGYTGAADAWPVEFVPFAGGECAPDDDADLTRDDRYLAAPPNF